MLPFKGGWGWCTWEAEAEADLCELRVRSRTARSTQHSETLSQTTITTRMLSFEHAISWRLGYLWLEAFEDLFICWVVFFETGFLCVTLAVLELTLDQAGLELRNLPAISCLCLLSAGIKDITTMSGLKICLFLFFMFLSACMCVYVCIYVYMYAWYTYI